MKVYDFKKYRTHDFITAAITAYLPWKVTRIGRMRAQCPRPGCNGVPLLAMVLHRNWPVAYCCRCHQSIDALDIVRFATGHDYYRSSEILDSMVLSG